MEKLALFSVIIKKSQAEKHEVTKEGLVHIRESTVFQYT